MRLQHLALVDFRNYAAAEWSPSPGANVLLGSNGAGKTNLLEAIHLVVTGVSPRAGRERDLVRWGREACSVRAQVVRDEFSGALDCQVVWDRQQGKSVRRGGKALTGAGRTAVLGGAVLFSPGDLDLVKGPPSSRRDYLDLAAAKTLPRYRGLLRRYGTALAHRNRLLADAASGRSRHLSLSELQPWTQQLITLGGEVLRHRLWALSGLAAPARAAYARLSDSGEALTLTYVPAAGQAEPETAGMAVHPANPPTTVLPGWAADHPPSPAATAAHLAQAFAERQADELARGLTLVGPHRDELILSIAGAPARVFGSQGEQRSVALSLRLAENVFLRQALQDTPLLLLDDVFSELDARRRMGLLGLLREAGEGHQTFLTGTDLAGVPVEGFAPMALFRVAEGRIAPADGH
ncbi:MAG: DNA replication/repair protein RecF [Bacillota bacterium]|nr:DNA replication/repair protein RecF [Bacillota bacterium]